MSELTEEQIRIIVTAVLDAEAERRGKVLDEVVIKAVATILTSFGMNEEDKAELQRDFVHLRKWRKSVEQAENLTFRVVLTAIIGGLVGAVWLGLKVLIGKS